MGNNRSKIDEDLMQKLDALADEEQIEALVHPTRMGENLSNFLTSAKSEGELDYNILEIANCIAVRASKTVILEIAAREDVSQVTSQPRLATN